MDWMNLGTKPSNKTHVHAFTSTYNHYILLSIPHFQRWWRVSSTILNVMNIFASRFTTSKLMGTCTVEFNIVKITFLMLLICCNIRRRLSCGFAYFSPNACLVVQKMYLRNGLKVLLNMRGNLKYCSTMS